MIKKKDTIQMVQGLVLQESAILEQSQWYSKLCPRIFFGSS